MWKGRLDKNNQQLSVEELNSLTLKLHTVISQVALDISQEAKEKGLEDESLYASLRIAMGKTANEIFGLGMDRVEVGQQPAKLPQTPEELKTKAENMFSKFGYVVSKHIEVASQKAFLEKNLSQLSEKFEEAGQRFSRQVESSMEKSAASAASA